MRLHDELVAAFTQRLADEGSRRVRLDRLVGLLVELRPELATASDRFARLAEIVEALGADGVVVAAKVVDVRHGVALPRSVHVTAELRVRGPNPAATHPWLPVLGWCGERRWPPKTLALLMQVNEWLARNPDRDVVPVRERSLEVLGDDKALGTLLRGSLARPEVRAALRVVDVHPPMPIDEVPGADGRGVLVVENGTTFHSLRTAAEAHAVAGRSVAWRWIGYGAGGQLATLLPSLANLRPDRIAYFGDVDPEGLLWAYQGAQAGRIGHELPELVPHVALYEALLDTGRPQIRPRRGAWPQTGLAWLGERVAGRLVRLLPDDRWLAQEWVGLEHLRRDTTWLGI